jgi:hypothetical protein
MAEEFKYRKLPDGTYLKFPASMSDDLIDKAAAGQMMPGPPMPSPDEMAQLKDRENARNQALEQNQGVGALFQDAFTMGGQAPVFGAAHAIAGATGSPLGGSYEQGVRGYNEALQQRRDEAGWGGTAADVSGSLLSGAPANTATRNAILWGMGKLGALSGAAHNAATPGEAATGAAVGGGIGLLGGKLLQSMTPKPKNIPGAIGTNWGQGAGIPGAEHFGVFEGAMMPKGAFEPTPANMWQRLPFTEKTGPSVTEKALTAQPTNRLASGLDLAGNILGSKAARYALIGGGAASSGAPGALAGLAVTGGLPAILKRGASNMRNKVVGPSKQLAEMMSPEVQAVLQGPPTREKLALMQMIGATRSKEGQKEGKTMFGGGQ